MGVRAWNGLGAGLGVLWVTIGTAAHAATPTIRYDFASVSVDGRRELHVTVKFRAPGAVTEIVVPVAWGGAENLEAQTQNLKTETPWTTLTPGANAGERQLHARAGEPVMLSWDIVPLPTGVFRHPAEHRAIVNDDYFLFNTQNALVYPAFAREETVQATFDWRKLPRGMQVFTSFGSGHPVIEVEAPWYRVTEGLFAGGNFRVLENTKGGSTLVLAVRGQWIFPDSKAFAEIRRILDTEDRFWRENPMPYYLVTLAPFEEDSGDNDGSAFANAEMLFLSRHDTFDADRLILLAHEMFHHWSPLSMGPTSDENQWFTEGASVYYASVILLRAGLIRYEDYLVDLNRRLRDYQRSPMRNITNAAWVQADHRSGAGADVPYSRGAALALWADARIRERSGGKSSLDDAMFDLVEEGKGAPAPALTEDRIFAALGRYLGPEDLAKLKAVLHEGADVPLPARLGQCAELETGTRTVVDPGFDEKMSVRSKRVTGVEPNGAAYRAGIRDGQELFRWSIYNDDPTKDALLGVTIDGEQKMIHFSPTKQMVLSEYRVVGGGGAVGCTPF